MLPPQTEGRIQPQMRLRAATERMAKTLRRIALIVAMATAP